MAGHQLPPAERRRAKLTQAAAEELRVPSRLPPARSAQQRLVGQHPIRPREILRQIRALGREHPRPADTPPDRPQASASNLHQVRKPPASRQILSRRWDANNRVLTGRGETLPDRNEEAPTAWTRTTIPVPAAQAARPNGAAASSAGPPRTISRAHISPPSPTTPPTTSSAAPSRGSRSSGRASSTYQRSTSPCTSSSRSSSPPNCNDCAMPSPRTIPTTAGTTPRGDRPSRQPATTPRRRDPPPPRSAPPHPHTGRLRHLSPQHPIPTPPRRKRHPRHGRRRRRKPHPRRPQNRRLTPIIHPAVVAGSGSR